MNNERICCFETNAAGDEADATVWGIRFELLCLGLSGVVATMIIVGVLVWLGRMNTCRAVLAMLPATATLGIAWFKQSHPPGHDYDLVDLYWNGPGFGPEPPSEPEP